MHGPPVMQGLFQRIQNEAVRPKRPTPRSDQKFQPESARKMRTRKSWLVEPRVASISGPREVKHNLR